MVAAELYANQAAALMGLAGDAEAIRFAKRIWYLNRTASPTRVDSIKATLWARLECYIPQQIEAVRLVRAA